MVYLLAGNMEGSQDRNRSTLVFPVLYIYHILSSRLRKLWRERKRDGLSYSVFFVSLCLFFIERIAPYNLKRIHTSSLLASKAQRKSSLEGFFSWKKFCLKWKKINTFNWQKILHSFSMKLFFQKLKLDFQSLPDMNKCNF